MQSNEHLYMPEDHMDALYRSENKLVRHVFQKKLETIGQLIPNVPGLTILDAGCGEGHLIEVLERIAPDHACVGIDATPIALSKAKIRCPKAVFHEADLRQMPFEDGTFDIVVCTDVIEHVPETEQALLEFRRVLKNGGRLILTFPNEWNWTLGRLLLGRRPVRVPDHVHAFTPKKIRRLVGLSPLRQVNLPWPLPFALSLMAVLVFTKP